MIKHVAAVVGLWLLVATGCKEGFQNPEIAGLPRDLEAGERQLIESDNAFGLKLFREVHADEVVGANIFLSPLSVAMALGMVYNGADGTTLEAMQESLELQGLSIDEVNRSYRSLIDLLADLDSSVQFTLANSIWIRETFPVEQDFIDVNVEHFDAEVASLDFDDPGAPGIINDWVDGRTNGRISDIVDTIPPEIIMFLINAIYFNGNWTTQFDPERTAPGVFNLKSGATVQVPMMTHGSEVELSTYYGEGVLVADLPYGGKAYSMTIALPYPGRDIDSLVASLDVSAWQSWIDGLQAAEMEVYLPKFTLEYEVGLNDALKALGMEIAFDELNADFSKISDQAQLFISKVKHKTFVDVNEEGTEAAAVTSVEVGAVSAPAAVRVDRPFLFAIRERFSGTILFIGVMHDPS